MNNSDSTEKCKTAGLPLNSHLPGVDQGGESWPTGMEVKVEGNAVVVTTTTDAQKTIAQFVALLQGQPQPMPARAIPMERRQLR